MDASWALVIAAAVTVSGQIINTLLTRQKLSDIKQQTNRIETRTDETHHQVRTSNGRTLAQVAEDTVNDLDEMRGDMMELAIQFARHMGDDHSHAMVHKMRQERRDREETARIIRELQEDPRSERRRQSERRSKPHYWDAHYDNGYPDDLDEE